jgi:hypothetical protein
MSVVVSLDKFERFFRAAGDVDIDKSDLRQYRIFINAKVRNLLIRAEATAKANGRDVVFRIDAPLTKGLQERLHEFEALLPQAPIRPALEQILERPPLDLAYGDDLEEWLPDLAGALTVALARTFKIVDPDVKNPRTEQWERAFEIFNLLL